MKIQIYWIIWAIILLILETPLVIRLVRYYKQFEISRQIAVIILMLLTAVIVWAVSNLGLTLAKFMVK